MSSRDGGELDRLLNDASIEGGGYAKRLDGLHAEIQALKRQLAHLTQPAPSSRPQTHLIIGDSHSDPEIPNDRYRWLGRMVADLGPDVVVDMGDWADMGSLSHFDFGKRAFEGRRYWKDIDQAVKAREQFNQALNGYHPRRIALLGNHEHRIVKATDDIPHLHGLISTDDLKIKELGWEQYDFQVPVVVDGIAYCLSPQHKVLTDKLNWIPLGDLKPGQTLLAFDENRIPHRAYKTSTVLRHTPSKAPLFRVILDNGVEFLVTADHRWLSRRSTSTETRWAHTYELKPGNKLPKLFEPWSTNTSREAGWLAGLLDGEGWLSKPNAKQGGIQIGFAQNPGAVLLEAKNLLDKFGYIYKEWNGSNSCKSIRILGSSNDKLRLLGTLRPLRLLEKFRPEMLGRVQSIGDVTVEAIEPYGIGEIVQLETSTGTLIADGFGHHNCHYFHSGVNGKPISGMNLASNIVRLGLMSGVQGHSHTFDYSERTRFDGERVLGMSVGCYFAHFMPWAKSSNSMYWRGIVVLRNVRDGYGTLEQYSLEAIEARYGGD